MRGAIPPWLGAQLKKHRDNFSFTLSLLREMGFEGVDWMHLAQDRAQWWGLVNTVMSLS
jgi:hypothetical protein